MLSCTNLASGLTAIYCLLLDFMCGPLHEKACTPEHLLKTSHHSAPDLGRPILCCMS